MLVRHERALQPGAEGKGHARQRADRMLCAHALRSAYRQGTQDAPICTGGEQPALRPYNGFPPENVQADHYILQYLVRRVDGVSRKIVVPDAQMEQFIRVSRTDDERLTYLKPEEINLSKGTRVRILGGAFDGVEGIFVKVKGKRNRRVVVLIDHVSAIAVSEISPDLIEVLDA